MARIKIHHDKCARSLVVWFGDASAEVNCDHTDSDVIIMLDDHGLPLGIEVLNWQPADDALEVAIDQVETGRLRSPIGA